MGAVVTKYGVFDMQVCIPVEWSDEEVEMFANKENLCGTSQGWKIRKTGDPALRGAPERNPCLERAGFVHVMLDC